MNLDWSFTTQKLITSDPLEISPKWWDRVKRVSTMSLNISSMIDGPKWRKERTLSEEWTGTSKFLILRTRLPEGYEWVNARPTKIPNTTRPDSVAWGLDTTIQKTHGQINCIDRWQRLFQGDCWRSSETGKGYCSCFAVLAVHFKGGQSRGSFALLNSHWCQYGTVRFRKQRSMRKSKAKTHGSHCRQRACGKCSPWFGTYASRYSRSFENTRSHCRIKQRMRKIKKLPVERKESKIQGRGRPSCEERWKQQSTSRSCWTSVTWNWRNTSRNTWCEFLVRQRQGRRRIQSSIHGARHFSFTVDSGKILGHHLKAFWCGRRSKLRSFSVHSGQDDRSSQIVTIPNRRMSRDMD